jgi:hypothetical protein
MQIWAQAVPAFGADGANGIVPHLVTADLADILEAEHTLS